MSAAAAILLIACSDSEPAVSAASRYLPDALEVTWTIEGEAVDAGDAPLAVALPGDDLLIGDAQIGVVHHVTSGGAVRTPAITPGNGPWQGPPPFSLWADGSHVFAIGTGFAGPYVATFSWEERSSGAVAPRDRAEASSLRTVGCGSPGCLVIEGSALAVGTVMPRPGDSWTDSATYGWWHSDSDSSPVDWLLKAPMRRMVAFDWPDGPLPAATGEHELDLGTLVTVSGSNVWSLDTRSGEVNRFRHGVRSPASTKLHLGRAEIAPDLVEESTRTRLADAKTELERNRIRATRDLKFLPWLVFPYARWLLPATGGGVFIELFTDGVPDLRGYVRVDSLGAVVDTVTVPGSVRLLAAGKRVAVGYSSSDDRVFGFKLPSPAR
jgi:hypothetical protein